MSPQQQSGEKTEKATPKKRRDTRQKGQVFKSIELVTAFSLIVMVAALSVFGKTFIDNIKQLEVSFFSPGVSIPAVMDTAAISPFLMTAIGQFLLIMAPLLLAALLAGLVFNYLQVGFLFSTKAMAPKFERVSIIAGFKRIFSKRTLVDLLKSILKIAILGVVGYNEFIARMNDMPMLMWDSLPTSIQAAVDILVAVAFKLGIALAILAPFDFLYQWWQHQKDLMMTKQEVKDEYKLTEGDPQIKGQDSPEAAPDERPMRMMQAVPNADVIITNPDALRNSARRTTTARTARLWCLLKARITYRQGKYVKLRRNAQDRDRGKQAACPVSVLFLRYRAMKCLKKCTRP